ncbi:MAG: hypothetical protein JNM13_12650 [Hyphomicrobiaceae bacterium]|nr:hypothetical protein [Hyphomicrobiaceae bacterium]
MSNIVLSTGVRDNLLSLQSTSEMMTRTQGRLATGRKVNSALDNPTSFFTSQGLSNRATDLSGLLDDLGQSIQIIKAADQGITAMSKMLESAKAKANQALQTADRFERSRLVSEYNDLLGQLSGIARDASYNGKNLLAGDGNQVTVYFNEENSAKLVVDPVDYTDPATALSLPALTVGTAGSTNVTLTTGAAALTSSSLLASSTAANAGDVITFSDANGAIGSITVTATMTVAEFVTEINAQFSQVEASFSSGTLTIEAAQDITFTGGQAGAGLNGGSVTATESSWLDESSIRATLGDINQAIRELRTQAATFGTNLSVLQQREKFTRELVNVLNVGSDELVVADTNEEGANLLALQTRQQLSSTALSLASQSDQAVLRLFG